MSPRSPEEVAKERSIKERVEIRQNILLHLSAIMSRYEPFYKDQEPGSTTEALVTRSRYQLFETWLGDLLERGYFPKDFSPLQEVFVKDVEKIQGLYEALQNLARNEPISDTLYARFCKLGEKEMRIYVDYTSPPDPEYVRRELSRHPMLIEEFASMERWNKFRDADEIGTVNKDNGPRVMRVFSFGGRTSTPEVLGRMMKEGYRPATIPELYAWAVAKSHLWRDRRVLALGSRYVRESREKTKIHWSVVPYVEGRIVSAEDKPERDIGSCTHEGVEWRDGEGFLAIKLSPDV